MSEVQAVLGGCFAFGLLYGAERGIFYQTCLIMSIPLPNVEPQLVWNSGKNPFFERAKVLLAVITSMAFVGLQLSGGAAFIAFLSIAVISFIAFCAFSWKRAYDTFGQVTGFPAD